MTAPTRRAVLAGACTCGLLTACSGPDEPARPGAAAPAPSPSTGPRTVPVADIPVGGSIVVSVDVIYPVAVARTDETTFAVHSAVCTHQGCQLKPGTELELDCPCHGSRFDAASGKVLGGPATRALKAWRFSVDGDVLNLHAHEDDGSSLEGGGSGSGGSAGV